MQILLSRQIIYFTENVSQPEPSMEWSAIADRAAGFMFLKEILRGIYFTNCVG
jgi:hypothetical protein